MKIKRRSVIDIEIIIMLFLCGGIYLLYQANLTHEELIIHGGYLYKDLDLTKSTDQEEYKKLIENRSQILEYQTQTSDALNKFFDTIENDILKTCEKENSDSSCIADYFSLLYGKLKKEIENPRSGYLGEDTVLWSYYNDLKGNHPFVYYFLDFYDYINTHNLSKLEVPEYPYGGPYVENTQDREQYEKQFLNTGDLFYTYGGGNINIVGDESVLITNQDAGIIVKGEMVDWMKETFGYRLPYGPINAPIHGPFTAHYDNGENEYLYQIYKDRGDAEEFYLLVRIKKNKYRIPIGDCGYMRFFKSPQLFGSCSNRTEMTPHSVLTLGEKRSSTDKINNIKFFLRSLENTRILSY